MKHEEDQLHHHYWLHYTNAYVICKGKDWMPECIFFTVFMGFNLTLKNNSSKIVL